MLAAERRHAILRALQAGGAVRVADLAAELDVSEMTVRRDLDAMDAQELLRKVHGGAVSWHNRGEEPWSSVKAAQQRAEKAAIATVAAGSVEDGMTIAISAGTTTTEFARRLRHRSSITVVTNSVSVFSVLTDPGTSGADAPQVYLSGGVRTPSDALVGPIADAAIASFRVDATYLGVHGFDPDAGLTTPNIAEAQTNQTMIGISPRLIVVADHTKFGEIGTNVFAPLSRIDTLVVDDGLAEEDRAVVAARVGTLTIAARGRLAVTTPTRWPLADGRDLLFFSLPGHRPAPVDDLRPLPPRGDQQSQLRFDRQTGQWVIIAALRQDRTYKPRAEACPLCPGPSGSVSEVPAPGYDVVVFENRFPSLSGAGGEPFALPAIDGDLLVTAPGHGRCEVICFSSDHTGSFADLTPAHARLVVDAWRHRTADLMARPGIAHVFCFENRGEEIGVTLTHPHGQIYGYPYLPPRAELMLREARAYAGRTGHNLFADILGREVADGTRVVARTESFTAFVPFAARWPVEVHIYPNRLVHNITELTDAELDGFADIYLDVLGRFDRMYSAPLPYISALHQYTGADEQREGYFHVELMSVRRSATKLKFLAGSESAMDAFISDVAPESVAVRLREL